MARPEQVEMKVDLVIGALQIGGAERQIAGLAIELHKMDVDVQVITLSGGGPLLDTLVKSGVQVLQLQERNESGSQRSELLQVPVKLVSLWRRRRPDAVQAWLSDAQVVALPAARVARVPVRIMAIRSLSSALRMTRMKRLALEIAARASTAVVANSTAALADRGWPISGTPQYAIPNAVDVPLSTAEVTTQPPTGVMVANFLAYKGHQVLLQALSQMPAPPQMRLVGTGPLLEDIRRRTTQLGLANMIDIHEGVTDPRPLLMESQFAVLPSFTEGTPNAVLEAMAAGLPVVASRVGGVPELIRNGVEGYLVNPGDVNELARALQQVVDNPVWRQEAGRQGRKRVQGFTWHSLAERNLEIMKQGYVSG